MSREIAPVSARFGGAQSLERDHAGGPFRNMAESFGAFYAALAGFTIGRFEALADRNAERRSARLRSRIHSQQQIDSRRHDETDRQG